MAQIAAAIAGTTAVGAYLNAKFHISKDLHMLKSARKAQSRYAQNVKSNRISCFYFFEKAVNTFPDHVAIWTPDRSYTSQEAFKKVCQYSAFLLEKNVRPGEVVALYLRNSPEFIFAWLALWAIGCAPAMINFTLAGDSLLHCLKISKARLILADEEAECQQRLHNVQSGTNLEQKMDIFILDDELKRHVDTKQALRPGDEYRENVKGNSPGAIFYSSGTTGLPKGTSFSFARTHMAALIWGEIPGSVPGPGGDIWYDCMPMYHASGGHSAMGCMMTGVTLAIGRRFSVKNFWDEVRGSGATFFTYVGETARYLLAAPSHPLDKVHNVRCMYGNGLRPDVWRRFRDRFRVPEIYEIFNSSEGMLGLLNLNKGDFTADCVGHHGALSRLAQRNNLVPVQVSHETGDLIRDPKSGFVERRPYEEGGEILVRVSSESDFPGYWNNPEATQKKFVYDVFKKGDIYFRTGDALRRDAEGRWYFLDRLGDTYRWKSENVSTAEVAHTVGRFPGVLEAIVYGVQLPGHDGRAGCVALSIDPAMKKNFDWQNFCTFANDQLPRYAVPIFVRVLSGNLGGLAMHNNKQDKKGLQAEGVDPSMKGANIPGGQEDIVLFLKPGSTVYVPFGEDDWTQIASGRARL